MINLFTDYLLSMYHGTLLKHLQYFSEHRSMPSLHSINSKEQLYSVKEKKNSKREADRAEHGCLR